MTFEPEGFEPRQSGKVEGQVNRPKPVKRQIYDRAKIDLFNVCRMAGQQCRLRGRRVIANVQCRSGANFERRLT
jgi:hypothetical protein